MFFTIRSAVLATVLLLLAQPGRADEYNWSGFYAGLGVMGTNASSDVGGTTFPPLGDTFSLSTDKIDAQAGVLAGYNFDINGPLVLGAEVLGQFGGVATLENQSFPGWVFPGQGTSLVSLTDQYSLRARIGFEAGRGWLLFGTAGVSQGEVEVTGSYAGLTPTYMSYSASESLTGYTVGIGAEKAFSEHFSVRAEVNYTDLGSISAPIMVSGVPSGTNAKHEIETVSAGIFAVWNF